MAKMLYLYNFTVPYPGGRASKSHALRAHMPEAATDWMDSLSLETMSVSGYIENVA